MFFWGDERCVPPDYEAGNYRMVREALIEHVPWQNYELWKFFKLLCSRTLTPPKPECIHLEDPASVPAAVFGRRTDRGKSQLQPTLAGERGTSLRVQLIGRWVVTDPTSRPR